MRRDEFGQDGFSAVIARRRAIIRVAVLHGEPPLLSPSDWNRRSQHASAYRMVCVATDLAEVAFRPSPRAPRDNQSSQLPR
jgi:hypothetical protein